MDYPFSVDIFCSGDKGKILVNDDGVIFTTLLILYFIYLATLYGFWQMFFYVFNKPDQQKLRVGLAATIAAAPLLILLVKPPFIVQVLKPVNLFIINTYLNNNYASILNNAIYKEDAALIQELVSAGIDIDVKNKKGTTALLEVLYKWPEATQDSGNRKTFKKAKILLGNGANASVQDRWGNTPFLMIINRLRVLPVQRWAFRYRRKHGKELPGIIDWQNLALYVLAEQEVKVSLAGKEGKSPLSLVPEIKRFSPDVAHMILVEAGKAEPQE